MRRWFRNNALRAGVALVVAALAWWAWRTSRLPEDQRGDASGFGQFLLAALGLALAAIGWLLRRQTQDIRRSPAEVAPLLATAVTAQWTRAAGERGLLEPAPIPIRWRRSPLPVTGPPSAALGTPDRPAPFPPLPGLGAVREEQLSGGGRRELHQIYGGLASGRLVIVGAPGAGKSGAATLLLLDALQHREELPNAADRARVPVPVLFPCTAGTLSFSGWRPGSPSGWCRPFPCSPAGTARRRRPR